MLGPTIGLAARDPLGGTRDVHRPALPAAQAGPLREQLGHHAIDVRALRQAVTVSAVRRCDVVVLAQCRANPDRDRLLTERRVDEARDLPVAVQLADPGLEGT